MVAAPQKSLPVAPRLSQATEGSRRPPSAPTTHSETSSPAGPRKKLSRASAQLSPQTQYIASYYTKLPPKITVPSDPFQLRDVQPAISSPVRLQPRSWKPSLPYFSQSSTAMKSSNATHEAGKSSGKSKFLNGWKPSIFSKAKPKPTLQISSGRENNTFDRSPDFDRSPERPTRLPPLLPSSPTAYTETTFPPESMIAESDVGTSVSRRPRNNRPVPPTPSLSRGTTPKKRTRRLPAPSTAGVSWVTYGRFDTPAPPSTYNGDQSMYMPRNSGETGFFQPPPSGIGEITDTGDGLTSLASRPATPSVASPLREEPFVPPTPVAPARPSGPSIVINGMPEEPDAETHLVESPSDMASHMEGLPDRVSKSEGPQSPGDDEPRSRRSSRPVTATTEAKFEKAETSVAGSRAGSQASSQGSLTRSERGTVGDLTRTNTRVSRATARRRLSRPETAQTGQSRPGSPGESVKSPATATVTLQEQGTSRKPRKQVFARRPTNRYSHKPFHYYNRYPEHRLSQASRGKGNRISDNLSIGRMTASTTNGSNRTYISSRVGRLKRLWQDVVEMPWRGDSDYYGGTRGITATHHFRSSGGVGGGVSNRPKRDSRIPRAPWYRPKFQNEMMENGAMMANYPAMRIPMGESGPLTDGSERSVMERIALPASASPFISPFPMRSPYDTPDSGPRPGGSAPSPLGNGLHGQPPPSAFTPFVPGMKMPRTQVPGFHPSQRTPGSTPNGISHPPSAFHDGYFSNAPPPMGPPLPHRVPPVPSTAFESMYSIGGVTTNQMGPTPVWLPYPLPDNALDNIAAHQGYPNQHRQPRDRGVPVTIHATTTIHSAVSSPGTRYTANRQSEMTTGEYSEAGIAK